ncbi:hypothetical protein [Alysiella crassa]|uniref:Lipoprotein n=1 Tax=Alysiella crassa TaxID=153491 RepID=A0A376BLR5_9NEIS|nr:hypothetical protein [Alysiella crassa]UOP07265.1 hypothetical protein LVJ80_02120 [Alysiella crassa]SSY70563.1 Uncharacterised protein [Alysiella crassa]
MKKWFVCFAIVLGLSGCKPIENMTRIIESNLKTTIQVIQFFFPFTRPNRYPPHTWQEEVRLADGSIILVERTKKNRHSSLRILDTKGLNAPPTWSNNEFIFLLDKDKDGIWYIVTKRAGELCTEWGAKLYYKQYKAINGQWKLVEFDTKLDGRRNNLHYNIYQYHDFPVTFNSNAYKDLPKILKIDDNERHYLNFHEMKGHDIRYKRSTSHIEIESHRFPCE